MAEHTYYTQAETFMCISFVRKERDWESFGFHLPVTFLFKNLFYFFFVRKWFNENPHPNYEVEFDLENIRCHKTQQLLTEEDLLTLIQQQSFGGNGGYSQETLNKMYESLKEKLEKSNLTWEEATGYFCQFCFLNIPCNQHHHFPGHLIQALMFPSKWITFGIDKLIFPVYPSKHNIFCPEYNEFIGLLLNRNTRHLWESRINGLTMEEPVRVDDNLTVMVDYLLSNPRMPVQDLQGLCLAKLYTSIKLTNIKKEEIPVTLRQRLQETYRSCYTFNWCSSWKAKHFNCTRGVARNILGIPCPLNGTRVQECRFPHHTGHFHTREHPDCRDLWFKDLNQLTSGEKIENENLLWTMMFDKQLRYRQELIHTQQQMQRVNHPNAWQIEHVRGIVEEMILSFDQARETEDFQLPVVGEYQAEIVPEIEPELVIPLDNEIAQIVIVHNSPPESPPPAPFFLGEEIVLIPLDQVDEIDEDMMEVENEIEEINHRGDPMLPQGNSPPLSPCYSPISEAEEESEDDRIRRLGMYLLEDHLIEKVEE